MGTIPSTAIAVSEVRLAKCLFPMPLTTTVENLTVRRLSRSDAESYRAICEVGEMHPGFCHVNFREDTAWYLGEVSTDPNHHLLGAFDSKGVIVGVGVLARLTHPACWHRVTLDKIYALGSLENILKALVRGAIEIAERMDGVRQIEIEVVRGDSQLLGVATREGFQHYGDRPDALKVDGVFYDQHFLVRRVALV